MSEIINGSSEPCARCDKKKPNLCNDLVYTFGSNKGCRAENHPLETTGGTHIGYGINEGKLREIKIVWDGAAEADEVIVVQKNGQDVAWVHIEGQSGVECAEVSEWFCDCDVVNVVSRASGVRGEDGEEEPGIWVPAGCITVTLEVEPKCNIEFLPEGDGIAEAVDTTGTTEVAAGGIWYTRTLNFERNNTMPTFAQFNDSDDSYDLEFGVYKIWYTSGILFEQSVALEYALKLQTNTNGGGWVDYPHSETRDYVLAGDDGNVVASNMVTLRVPHGDTVQVRLQEKISVDTSVQTGDAGGKIIVERVANGIATFGSLHAGVVQP